MISVNVEEKELISQIKRMGTENEDADKLMEFCQKAYRTYRDGKISANAYEKVYMLAKSYMRASMN